MLTQEAGRRSLRVSPHGLLHRPAGHSVTGQLTSQSDPKEAAMSLMAPVPGGSPWVRAAPRAEEVEKRQKDAPRGEGSARFQENELTWNQLQWRRVKIKDPCLEYLGIPVHQRGREEP